MGMSKGCMFSGFIKSGIKAKPAAKNNLSIRERVREIVAEIMLQDPASITDNYPLREEIDLLPDGFLDMIDISFAIESEYKLPEIFNSDNERIFVTFDSLVKFVEKAVSHGR
jgi:acyl carrier protein